MLSCGRMVVSLAPFTSCPRPIQSGCSEILRDDHALMDVERPAVVAGQVVHVGGIGDDQGVETGRRHALLRLRRGAPRIRPR